MKSLDYIIVGQGIAGSCVALELLKGDKSFVVINHSKPNSASKVAAGMYNPVVLYRFSKIWNAEEQLNQLHQTFSEFESILGKTYNQKIGLKRIFKSESEIETWQKKSKREDLKDYLNVEIQNQHDKNIYSPLGLGIVNQTGKIRIKDLLEDFKNYLIELEKYKEEEFLYDDLIVEETQVQYKEFKATRIIFCEGIQVKRNPYFDWLPIIGNKGNVLKVELKESIEPNIYKSKIFLAPNSDGKSAYVGSTYERDYENENPTEESKQTLKKGLESFYQSSYEIMEHNAAIRPTVSDRRPIIGQHPEYSQLYVCNGMGTRGTLLAPTMAKELYNYLENNQIIDSEVDIARF